MTETYSDRIKNLRLAKKWNQAELGRRVGVSRAAVTQWESGSTKLNQENLVALANVFRVTPEYIVTGKTDHQTPECMSSAQSIQSKQLQAIGEILENPELADAILQIREYEGWQDILPAWLIMVEGGVPPHAIKSYKLSSHKKGKDLKNSELEDFGGGGVSSTTNRLTRLPSEAKKNKRS
jgi:transcriptional regulator with XRE-family HTH domain